jgi:hypothetical protein
MFEPKKYFTAARKEYIEKPLKKLHFKRYKTSTIARLTDDNIFQFIEFQKSIYGGQQFTMNIAMRPLYCLNEYLTLSPGRRLGNLAYGKDTWWNYSDEEKGEKSFLEIALLIDKFVIPFFEATVNASEIIKSYEKDLNNGIKLGWGSIGWVDFDFGHIYLKAGDKINSINHFDNCYNIFINDNRDWAQKVANECLEIKNIIEKGQIAIENYLTNTILKSKQNLKLTDW